MAWPLDPSTVAYHPVVLLAHRVTAMHRLLSVCDSYASEYNILLNAKKSKCLLYQPMTYRFGIQSALLTFMIRDRSTENVD